MNKYDYHLDHRDQDRLIRSLTTIIRLAVRLLAVAMTVLIFLGVVDVVWTLHQKAMAPPRYILTISDILSVFGAFLAVLIAIEIFVNITVYLRENVIHVRIVIETALMAIARKVIILDYESLSPDYVWGTAAVVVAMSIAYWLVIRSGDAPKLFVGGKAAGHESEPSTETERPPAGQAGRSAES